MKRELGAVFAACGIIAACSFPDPEIVGDGGASNDGGSEDAGDGGGGRIDASSCTSQCDCDGDGVIAMKPECPGGRDCDDYDPRVRPGADFTDVVPEAPNVGNWNCDDQVEKRWGGNVACSPAPGSDCTKQGFVGEAPACGVEGTWVECAPAAIGCQEKQRVTKKQQCR